MTIPTNRQFWEAGLPLDQAWLEFANADARSTYSSITPLTDFNQQLSEGRAQSADALLKAIASGFDKSAEKFQMQKQLRELLLDELFNGQLHAYGYRIGSTRSRSPVRIAAEFFDECDADWKQGTIAARGLKFSDVRVIDPSEIKGFRKPRVGRKGSGGAIQAAIAKLMAEGFDLCGVDRKTACNEIRRKIGSDHPKGSGLSNPNLNKYILKVCSKRGIDNS